MIFLASLEQNMDDKLEGYQHISTREELNQIVCDNKQVNKVIVRRDFAEEYFTASGLEEYIRCAKALNRNLIIEMEVPSKTKISSQLKDKLRRAKTTEELTTLSIKYPKEFKDVIDNFLKEDNNAQSTILAAENRVSRLQAIVDEQKRKLEEMEQALSLEQTNKFLAMSKLDALIKRINYQYNVGVEEGKMFEVSEHRFDKILYFKEYTRVQYMDSFIYYLRRFLKSCTQCQLVWLWLNPTTGH